MQRSVIWGTDKPTVVVFHRLGFYNEKEQKECADLREGALNISWKTWHFRKCRGSKIDQNSYVESRIIKGADCEARRDLEVIICSARRQSCV